MYGLQRRFWRLHTDTCRRLRSGVQWLIVEVNSGLSHVWIVGSARRLVCKSRKLDLTDEQAATLLTALDGIIEIDRFFLSPRISTLKAIRSKLRPDPVRHALPPVKYYELP